MFCKGTLARPIFPFDLSALRNKLQQKEGTINVYFQRDLKFESLEKGLYFLIKNLFKNATHSFVQRQNISIGLLYFLKLFEITGECLQILIMSECVDRAND